MHRLSVSSVKIQWLKHEPRTDRILLREQAKQRTYTMRTRLKNRMLLWVFVRVKPFQCDSISSTFLFFFHSIFGCFFGPNFHESVKCLVPFRLFRIWILELKWSRLDIRRSENQNQHGENAHDWCEFVPTKVHWGAQQIHTRIHRNFLGFCSFAHVHKLSTMNTRFAFDCESRKGDQTLCMCRSSSVCVFNGVVQHTV